MAVFSSYGVPPVALSGNEICVIEQNNNTYSIKLNTLLAALMPQYIASLPTVKPGTPGMLWLDGGVMCVS